MINLLRAGIEKIKRDLVFIMTAMLVISFETAILVNNEAITSENCNIGSYMFGITAIIGIIASIFIGIFIGDEYADKAIRNKIIIGYNRKKIYLVNLILMSTITLFYVAFYMGSAYLIGAISGHEIGISSERLWVLLLDSILLSLVVASLLTCISMNTLSQTVSIVGGITVSIWLIIIGFSCYNSLRLPPTIQELEISDGKTITKMIPNPDYPSETKREILKFLMYLNPFGQSLVIGGDYGQDKPTVDFNVMPFYSLGVILISTAIGMTVFNRKELK